MVVVILILIVKKNLDGQLCVTIKKSIPKIVATPNRIADSYMMVELQAKLV